MSSLYSPYQDKWGRYHDKPCIDGEPSSNNGWLYTAYAKALGFPLDHDALRMCYSMCHTGPTTWLRSPGDPTPPMSRDEILGMVGLGLLPAQELTANGWSFCPYEVPPFSMIATLAALWRMRKAHRNALWEGDGEPHLWRFAFSVPMQDRAYIMGDDASILYRAYAWLSGLLPARSDSSWLLAWLKGGEDSMEILVRYFGPHHPFTQAR